MEEIYNVELIYIKFFQHPVLADVEINFSQEFDIEISDDELNIDFTKNRINLFENSNITDLKLIIGKNGVGKTTLINTILKITDGNISSDMIYVLKINDEFKICTSANIKLKEKLEFRVSLIKNKNEFFKKYGTNFHEFELFPIIYRSEAIDKTIDKTNSRLFINCSSLFMIENPEFRLNIDRIDSNKDFLSLEKNLYNRIKKINQMNFLSNKHYDFKFKLPDSVEIKFENVISKIKNNLEEKSNGYIYIAIDLFERYKNIRTVFDLYLFMSIHKTCPLILDAFEVEFEQYMKFHIYIVNSANKMEKDYVLDSINYLKKSVKDFGINDEQLKTFYNIVSSYEFFMCEIWKDNFNKKTLSFNLKFEEACEFTENLMDLILLNELFFDTNYDFNDLEKMILKSEADILEQIYLIIPDEFNFLKNNVDFYFSSGEEAFLELLMSIDLGVKELTNNIKRTDQSIMILLDEPCNSFHPEMQKNFISDLSEYLNSQNKGKFYVMLTAHSPILASDLTRNHVIFLNKDNGKIYSLKDSEKPKTFAQNIYNLYRESFFLENNLFGNYANDYIMDIVTKLRNEDFDTEQIEFIIDEIGEPILANELKKIYKNNNKLQKNTKFQEIENILEGLSDSEKEKLKKMLERK